MLIALAIVVTYGMGMGATVAICNKLIDDMDGLEAMAALFWPLFLPAMIMWWVVNSWMGGDEEDV